MMRKTLGLFAFTAMLLAASSANAAFSYIVNLNADPTRGPVNAGNNSGSYAYNPVTLTGLAVGRYSVSVAGIAGGTGTVNGVTGLYDAYSVATPATGNWTDAYWSVSTGGVVQTFTGSPTPTRYATAIAAFNAYSVATPLYFVVTSVGQTISFYVDDAAAVYFADDTGGLSLGINSAVPEPLTIGLLGIGLAGIGAARRKRRPAVAA